MFSVITYYKLYISTHLCFDVFDCAEEVQEDTLILTLSFLSLDAFQLNMLEACWQLLRLKNMCESDYTQYSQTYFYIYI